MTADRELLEAAAKAAGIEFRGGETFKPQLANLTYVKGDHAGAWELWMPLHDDGDALRLAVKLRIEFGLIEVAGLEFCEVNAKDYMHRMLVEDDELSCVRRAIVRAAAAMAPKTEPA